MSRRLAAGVAAAALALGGCQAIVGWWLLPREGIRPHEFQVQVERDASFVTSDAVRLVADIYRPRVDGRTPTILVRIPFSQSFRNNLGADVVGEFWASRGYTVVVQGTRGRFKSGGQHYPLRHERADGIATLQWLARQPWFDGRLGMWGGSAFGHTQWVLADQSEPGPQALLIQIASTGFGEMFHPAGAFSLESALFWAVRSRGAEDQDPSFRALERGFAGFPLIEADDRAVGDIPFFNDWVRHKPGSGYWRAIDGMNRASTTKAPVLLMAGWYDPFLPTQLADWRTIQREAAKPVAERSRLIIGPWSHADPVRFPDGSTAGDYRPASLAPTIPWFDHHLLGRPLDASLAAPVRIYVMGENVWRNERQWPLARAVDTPFYLAAPNLLTRASPAHADVASAYVYDPRNPVPSRGGAMLGPRAGIAEQSDVESRRDVLVYTSEPLKQALEVTGPITAVLFVKTSAPNTDFTVKLVDVHPDGRAFNVSDGILRRAYQAQDSSTEITIELWPTSMLFRAGHRIRVEVSSSNYPRYDRNPNTGGDIATETAAVPATQTVYYGARSRSRIILPVVPR
jgi:putative CocE/NonD family hydrolase